MHLSLPLQAAHAALVLSPLLAVLILPILSLTAPAAARGTLGFALGTKNADGSCKTTADYQADFDSIYAASGSTLVRGYSASDCDAAARILPAAASKGFRVVLGVWCVLIHSNPVLSKLSKWLIAVRPAPSKVALADPTRSFWDKQARHSRLPCHRHRSPSNPRVALPGPALRRHRRLGDTVPRQLHGRGASREDQRRQGRPACGRQGWHGGLLEQVGGWDRGCGREGRC